MPGYKFTYFDFEGLGERVRLAFVLSGIEFQDARITQEEWAALKPSTPSGKVPLLEIDGKAYTQSSAQAAYVGTVGGLVPTNPEEQLAHDEIIGAVGDFFTTILMPSMAITRNSAGMGLEGKTEEELKAIATKLQATASGPDGALTGHLKFIDGKLKETGTGYAIGSKSTLADAYLISGLRLLINGWFPGVPSDIYSAYPAITKYLETQYAIPAVKAWYKL